MESTPNPPHFGGPVCYHFYRVGIGDRRARYVTEGDAPFAVPWAMMRH